MRKRVMHYLLLILVIMIVFTLWLIWREPKMIYYPTQTIDYLPNQYGLLHEDITLLTSDSVRINAWYLPADSHRWTLLFLHGNAGNISHRLDKLAAFHKLGISTLILDYRGYGQSQGEPNEQGTYLDALAAYDYLVNERALSPETLIAYGESLGAAVAIELATQRKLAGLILEEPFTSAPDVAQEMFPFLPVRWFVRNRYESIKKIDSIHAPLLILHSAEDEIFSIKHAKRLLAKALPPKELVQLRGNHNDAFFGSNETIPALTKFFNNLTEPHSDR